MGNDFTLVDNVPDSKSSINPLITKITAHLGKEFEDVRYDLSVPDDSFFVSDMFFLNITTNSSIAEKNKTVHLVVKRPPQQAEIRQMMKTDEQFHNEILFYQKYVEEKDNFPGCVYLYEKPPVDSLIVLQNICKCGYQISELKYNVPLEYTLAVMRELARFHAKGYTMKERRRDHFFSVVRNIQDTRFVNTPDNLFKVIVDATASRAVDCLRNRGYDKDLCDKLTNYLDNSFENIMLTAVNPEEPLATLCHGDFTLNNVFFKRDGSELKTQLIDFALIKYGSPVIDISTYLSLHCAKEFSTELIEKVLEVYHDSLIKCLEENGIETSEKFSYEAIHEDYRKKGMFGFPITTFFLSVVLGKSSGKPGDFIGVDIKECGAILREEGGDEISEILADMLLKLKEFGCLDHVV